MRICSRRSAVRSARSHARSSGWVRSLVFVLFPLEVLLTLVPLSGKLCIEVDPAQKIAFISEELCIGCGICPKKCVLLLRFSLACLDTHPHLCRCPFEAINIINLPTNLESQVTHRYSANSFKLHRLPTPRPGQVLGLVGTNGIGKSTALKILSGKLKPNLGRFDAPPDWQEILKYFRGSELQNYFTKVLEDNLKPLIKPQYVDHIPRAIKVKQTVRQMLESKLELDNLDRVVEDLDLQPVMERDIQALSGGELQRFAIGMSCVQDADMCVPLLDSSPCSAVLTSFVPQLHVRRAFFLPRR